MPTTLADLLKPSLRRAGITKLPGITPSADQYGELIGEMNRMYGSWNLTGLNVFHTTIETFQLVAGQQIYTMGPGGNFNTVRPQVIKSASIILGNNPAIRLSPVLVTTDSDEWDRLTIQELSGGIPRLLYNDRAFPLSSLYVYPQDSGANSIEIYSWNSLTDAFTAVTDVVALPPGYEDAIVNNFALRVAILYPREAKLDPEVRVAARRTLAAVQSLNAPVPTMTVDYPGGCGGGDQWPIVMGGGGGADVTWLTPLVAPNGVLTSFEFTSLPDWVTFNGLVQYQGIGYNVTGLKTIQLIDELGNIITPGTGDIIRGAV